MKLIEMYSILADRYGKQNVLIHTEHHTQIVVGNKKHDIWPGTKIGLKWRLAGMQRTDYGEPKELLGALEKYDGKKTDVAQMSAAVELCQVIDNATRIFEREKITQAIFCDAGFKNGKARIGVVLIDGELVKAIRRPVTAASIHEAEGIAVHEALAMAESYGGSLTIYTDSQSTAHAMNSERVKWISRDKNKVADKLANLRGKPAEVLS